MAKSHAMTPKRKAALRKAQLASARKRRGKGKGKLAKANRQTRTARRVALAAATGGLVLAAAGVAGAYYARKTAGGGPKAPKPSYAKSPGVRTSNVSLSRSRAGSLVVRKGTKRTRQRNRRRNNRSLGAVLNDRSMSTQSVMNKLNNPNYVWQL